MKLLKFDVMIKGTTGKEEAFSMVIEVDAEDEDKAVNNVREMCLKPRPKGLLDEFDKGPGAMTWFIERVTRKL